MGRYHAAARAFKYQLMSNGEQQRQMRRFAGSSTATRTQGLGQGGGGCQSGPHGTWAEEVLLSGSLHAPELAHAEATNMLRLLELAKLITTLGEP